MRFRLLTSLAAVTALTVLPAAAADAARPTTLKVRACDGGASDRDRQATFYSRMRSVPGTDRMQMRFTLLDRSEDRRQPVRIPELARWRRSRSGVKSFGYAQRVSGLLAGRVYAMSVEYRWLDDEGNTVKSLRRTSSDCRQGGSIANLAVTGITSKPGAAEGTEEYEIEIVNRGTARAADFEVDLIVDSAAADSHDIDELRPGEATTVKITGPSCLARVRAVVDRDDAVTETTEDDNTRRSRCPRGR
jgi:hypothetical protein